MLEKPFLFLLNTLILSHNNQQYYNACSSFSCGNFTFGFPFYETGQSSECGLPNFEVFCGDAGVATLLISNRSYEVKDLSLESRDLVLVDRELVDAVYHDECNLPKGFGFGDHRYFNPSERNGCLSIRICPLKGRVGKCSSIYCYSHSEDDGLQRGYISEFCEIRRYPVRKIVLPRAPLQHLTKEGFHVSWPPLAECEVCKKRGGSCRFNHHDSRMLCFTPLRGSQLEHGLAIMRGGLLVILVLVAVIVQMLKYMTKSNPEVSPRVADFLKVYMVLMPTRYPYASIKTITNNQARNLVMESFLQMPSKLADAA